MTNPYKYTVRATSRFKNSVKRITKRGKNSQKLKDVVEILAKGEALAETYKDHPLVGNWSGHRELHIEPDWLLVYEIKDDVLVLMLYRLGSHSDLFKK